MKDKCHWIIENYTNSQDYRDLAGAVTDSGRECYAIGPHKNLHFDASKFPPNACVIVQGSIQMTKLMREKLPVGCLPVAYNTWQNYLCSAYYPKFQRFLFNDKHEFTTFETLKKDKFEYYRRFGKDALIFVRPDVGDKSFSGQLVDLLDFDKNWHRDANFDDWVIVSTPKTINGEWRFVCSRWGEIIAQSTYQYQGQATRIPSAPVGATELCKEVLKVGYFPDSVFCVDVAEDADGNFWLLELTSFSSAGLYASNKRAIVDRVSEIAEKEWLDAQSKT